jgi:hypothetical protein
MEIRLHAIVEYSNRSGFHNWKVPVFWSESLFFFSVYFDYFVFQTGFSITSFDLHKVRWCMHGACFFWVALTFYSTFGFNNWLIISVCFFGLLGLWIPQWIFIISKFHVVWLLSLFVVNCLWQLEEWSFGHMISLARMVRQLLSWWKKLCTFWAVNKPISEQERFKKILSPSRVNYFFTKL